MENVDKQGRLCALIPRLHNRTRVLLLQHPSEVGYALNTARLANTELRVGEDFGDLDPSGEDTFRRNHQRPR
ncbi:DTW domain-containing protein [Zestomonas carbonaria]|uniref:Uncharacterized protein n=1 Tax=Zestomonas carbonaria TaxID=2762745 RepID=A0A7U7ELE6_9GAMM|nr:hypothetical protein PSEWESI4_01449 [Pseudomonas carbonaria]